MEITSYKDHLEEKIDNYDNLGKNIVQALELLLTNSNIKFVSIYYRIKSIESFIEKVERKFYDNPINQIEDICGVRIICYYQSDIGKISKIISNEFDIHNSEDKEDQLQADQFGYRSLHFIASIKEEWSKVPNYRDMGKLKAEIQVRTILMHAWAEIEHNLAYKKATHIPDKFKRKLFRISAKLEEADEQFEELKNESRNHQEDLLKSAKNKSLTFSNDTDVNLDTLQAFLDFHFPKRKKDIKNTSKLLDDLITYGIKYGDIQEAYIKMKPHLPEIEKKIFANNTNYSNWAQAGIVRLLMDMLSEEYNKRHTPKDHKLRVEWRGKYFS
jgi:putative GTP pyrophosphokinase